MNNLAFEFKQSLISKKEKWEQLFFTYKLEYPYIEEHSFEKSLLHILEILNKFPNWKTIPMENLTEIVFTKTLEMQAKKLIGENSHYPKFLGRWEYILESLGNSCYPHLEFLFSYLPNALLNLQKEKKFPIDSWIEDYIKIIPLCEDNTQLLHVGFVLAWKHGLAKLREQSLEFLNELPTNLIQLIFEINILQEKKKLFIEFIKQNPWVDPKSFETKNTNPKMKVHVVGGYASLDGVFQHPPIFYQGHANIVTDGQKIFEIHADFFGVSFVPITKEEVPLTEEKNKLQVSLSKNCILYKGQSFLLPSFPENSELKTTKDTFYIVSNFTNYLLVGGFENGNS